MSVRRSSRLRKQYNKKKSEPSVQTLANLRRIEEGKLDGQDRRVQKIMNHLCESFDQISLARLIIREFGENDTDLVMTISERITEMHCGGRGYTDADIAEQLEKLLI